jgi:hypothetical protein
MSSKENLNGKPHDPAPANAAEAFATGGEPDASKRRRAVERQTGGTICYDPEPIAMQTVADALDELEPRAQQRVLEWACDKFGVRRFTTDGEPA